MSFQSTNFNYIQMDAEYYLIKAISGKTFLSSVYNAQSTKALLILLSPV